MDNKKMELKRIKKENDAFSKAIRKLMGAFGLQQTGQEEKQKIKTFGK